ncbi:hypothetical protein ACJJIU_10420 [Microbulbifer sp. CnH-101-E]|uniref:phage tail assembly protein T n=1 Tax=unclassified Microbulbifer TaxID=2619833 RepID=UPI00403A0020
MLNGIGGCTIAEAQHRLSYEEVQRWALYRKKRGSLHPGMRIERSSALLATLYANTHRGKGNPVKITDFMPHEEEPELSLQEAMKSWH